jgi:hypothetical protein
MTTLSIKFDTKRAEEAPITMATSTAATAAVSTKTLAMSITTAPYVIIIITKSEL